MSLYERIDRESSKPRERVEFFLVYSICFVVLLISTTVRRLLRLANHRTASIGSIFEETRSMAAACAASSFMGM